MVAPSLVALVVRPSGIHIVVAIVVVRGVASIPACSILVMPLVALVAQHSIWIVVVGLSLDTPSCCPLALSRCHSFALQL